MSDISAPTDAEFDRALIGAVFALAGAKGWRRASVAAAAREAGLDLARARRFGGRGAFLRGFGRLADEAALAAAAAEGPAKDRLFDILMRRIDVLQSHRAGMLALMRFLPCDPPLALALARASHFSMGWMLEAAGISARGPRGALRAKGLLAVWLWTVRAWARDESTDLAATMAALDSALERAARFGAWLAEAPAPGGETAAPEVPPAEGAAESPPGDGQG